MEGVLVVTHEKYDHVGILQPTLGENLGAFYVMHRRVAGHKNPFP